MTASFSGPSTKTLNVALIPADHGADSSQNVHKTNKHMMIKGHVSDNDWRGRDKWPRFLGENPTVSNKGQNLTRLFNNEAVLHFMLSSVPRIILTGVI